VIFNNIDVCTGFQQLSHERIKVRLLKKLEPQRSRKGGKQKLRELHLLAQSLARAWSVA
jgi:hypothetical protein